MKNLLYVAHRIPYPPDKGDKIRSWHLIKRLAERWNVYLAAFVDDPGDWRYAGILQGVCAETKFVSLRPRAARIRALRGFANGTSLTMPYYENAEIRDWLSDVTSRREIDCAIAFSSSMAQYIVPLAGSGVRCVVDFCDMDSDKWRQYSTRFRGLRRWIYARESLKLRAEEAEIASRLDASVLISDDEAEIFCKDTGSDRNKVYTVRNGVDVAYFDPNRHYDSPFRQQDNACVFVGAMDYWPNVDAVTWFLQDVFLAVRARNPAAVFFIVGSNPTRDVRELGQHPGVTVTGRVEDVRPYLRHARCAVAPLRVARGVQNKVLEAMAMARPVVASAAALEGIDFNGDTGISVCDEDRCWVETVGALLDGSGPVASVAGARRHVAARYSWDASGRELADIVVGGESAC